MIRKWLNRNNPYTACHLSIACAKNCFDALSFFVVVVVFVGWLVGFGLSNLLKRNA